MSPTSKSTMQSAHSSPSAGVVVVVPSNIVTVPPSGSVVATRPELSASPGRSSGRVGGSERVGEGSERGGASEDGGLGGGGESGVRCTVSCPPSAHSPQGAASSLGMILQGEGGSRAAPQRLGRGATGKGSLLGGTMPRSTHVLVGRASTYGMNQTMVCQWSAFPLEMVGRD